jgi:hypothetical protein
VLSLKARIVQITSMDTIQKSILTRLITKVMHPIQKIIVAKSIYGEMQLGLGFPSQPSQGTNWFCPEKNHPKKPRVWISQTTRIGQLFKN